MAIVVSSSGGEPRSVERLIDANDQALGLSVRPGQRILEAQLFAPALQVRTVSKERLGCELSFLAELLFAHSPVVEPVPPSASVTLPFYAVVVDLTGAARPVSQILVAMARTLAGAGHRPVIAAAPTKRLALAVGRDMVQRPARYGQSLLVVDDRDRALSMLAVEALELSVENVEWLRATGVVHASELLPLMGQGLVERLGAQAREVVATLRGDVDIVSGMKLPERVVERIELEFALDALEPLLFVLRPLAQRLLLRLRARGQRLGEVRLTLFGRSSAPRVLPVSFPSPLLDEAALLRTLQVHLERLQISARIDAVELEATQSVTRAPRQKELFLEGASTQKANAQVEEAPQSETPEAVAALLAELTSELGASRVGCLVATRAPLPESMTELHWPLPPQEDPPAPRRRRPRPVATDPRTHNGRFLASWPWPLRILPRPVPLDPSVRIAQQTLLCRLSGDDGNAPWNRAYHVLVFDDGRRALGLYEEELDEMWVQGWFD